MSKKNPRVGGDLLASIRRWKKASPRFAQTLGEELARLRRRALSARPNQVRAARANGCVR
jgi:hypothetical protein